MLLIFFFFWGGGASAYVSIVIMISTLTNTLTTSMHHVYQHYQYHCPVSEYKAAKGDKKFFATCRDPELVSELTIQVELFCIQI